MLRRVGYNFPGMISVAVLFSVLGITVLFIFGLGAARLHEAGLARDPSCMRQAAYKYGTSRLARYRYRIEQAELLGIVERLVNRGL